MILKRIIDAMFVDQLFQKNEQGETVMYPHGLVGRGYALPQERVAEARREMRQLMMVALATGMLGAFVVLGMIAKGNSMSLQGWMLGIAVIALPLAGVVYLQLRLASGLKEASGHRPSGLEWLRRARMQRPTWSLWVEIALGVWLLWDPAVPGILSAFETGDYSGVASGFALVLLGAYVIWDGAMGLVGKAREKRSA
jgi:hypothetical protein